jgi:hypothetical protein
MRLVWGMWVEFEERPEVGRAAALGGARRVPQGGRLEKPSA